MLFQPEGRRLEPIYTVARRALASIRTLGELTSVRIRLVTIHALLKRKRFLEIPTFVTSLALHRLVLAQQGILRLRMIETFINGLGRNLLPSRRVVASLASLRKAAMVRITVAIGTLPERDSRIPRLIVRSRCMALCAGHLSVQSGEWILGLCVIELPGSHCDGFPVVVVMALQAIGAQPSLVLILMAGRTSRRNAEERLTQILDLDFRAFGRRDMLRRMAAIARQPCMLAFERVSGLFVVKSLDIPLDQREIFSIVFRVAARALLARSWIDVIGRMQSLMRSDARGNLAVTIQTLQSRCRSQFVATGAVGRAVQ